VKGKGCPKPIKTWAQCGVSKKELDVLQTPNYEKPTPIQAQALPAIMSGKHTWTWVNFQHYIGILYEVKVLRKLFCHHLFILMKN
jgi:molybdenum cofactor biosynthesis enzyme